MRPVGRLVVFVLTMIVMCTGVNGAEPVADRDAAIRVAKAACGKALDLPAEDHPYWDALPIGDHWSARLLSDYAPYPENPLMSVDVGPDGTTTDCIVHVGG